MVDPLALVPVVLLVPVVPVAPVAPVVLPSPPTPVLPKMLVPPVFGWPLVALLPKLEADCEVIPPPVTFTPCLSISMRGSYQNSQLS